MRKKFFVFIQILLLSLVSLFGLINRATASNVSEAPIYRDSIVVVVNDGVITEQQLNKRFQLIKQSASVTQKQSISDQTLRNQVLEQMILEKLQQQQADAVGIKISDQEKEQAIYNIAKARGLNVDQLQQRLIAEGLNWNHFQEEIKDEIKINHLRQQEIDQKIFISDAEIEEYLNQINRSNAPIETVEFEELRIKNLHPNHPVADSEFRKKANELLYLAIKNKSFSHLVKKSDPTTGIQMDTRHEEMQPLASLPENYQSAIVSLSNGEVANTIIEAGQELILLRLIDKKLATTTNTRQEFHVSHILRRVNNAELEAQALSQLADIKNKLEQGANFASLAKIYSEDPGSAAQGGELGWVRSGQMVPEFEQAMNGLPLQKVSSPVRTAFGYHLILIDQKRPIKETVAERNAEIRQLLAQKRAETKYLEWLAQLRDSAYIHYSSSSKPTLSK